MYNLYYVEKKGEKNWSRPELFSSAITNRYNQSAAIVDTSGQDIYFTANVGPTNTKTGDQISNDTLKNGIFSAVKGAQDWQNIKAFPFNNNAYDVGFPSLTSDGNRLYFCSKAPGGYGGYDIYYSDKVNGKWTAPVNLGPTINTAGSEVFPYIYQGNRLYFASDGHAGKGGTDIFYSDNIDGKWTTPVDMPAPFNSTADDFALVSNAAMDTGYFTSNRRGSDDIYQFMSAIPAFTDCPKQIEEKFCYQFYESTAQSLDSTSLKYEWDLGDGTKIRKEKVVHCYKEPGYYLVKLNVIDTLTNEVSYSEATYDLDVERVEQPYITSPDSAYVNDQVIMDASKCNIKSFTIDNYYWDYGDGSIDTGPDIKHSFAKPGSYMMRLGVTGSPPDSKEVSKACVTKKIIIVNKN